MFVAISNRPSLAGFILCLLANTLMLLSLADADDVPIKHRLVLNEHVTPLHTNQTEYHFQVRNIYQLANGNILAAHEGEGAVREVDPDGKVLWEYTGVENAGVAQRLANGNTLTSCGTQKRAIEVTPDKRIVWEFGASDAPELNITWVSRIQHLKNGNLIVGNFLRGQEGKGAHAFEVTRDKKVVWKWDDHYLIKSRTTVRFISK